MNKLAIPLVILAAATLSACGAPQVRAVNADATVFVTPVPGSSVRSGPGKIVELLDPTGPINGISWQRMTLKMDDGSYQIVDRRGHQVAMNSEVYVR
jgi:hypothetical protein